MCNKNVTTLLKKWASTVCFMIIVCSCARYSYAAPEHSPHDSSSTSTKPVRKGTLELIGSRTEVNEYQRGFYIPTKQEANNKGLTRYQTPELAGYSTTASSTNAFHVGVKYIPSGQDTKKASLQTEQLGYIVYYNMRVELYGVPSHAVDTPNSSAGVSWIGMDPNTDKVGISQGPSAGKTFIPLPWGGSIPIPTISAGDSDPLTAMAYRSESYKEDVFSPLLEPYPISFYKEMKCAAVIKMDGGLTSGAYAIATIRVYSAPLEESHGIKQYSAKEAFDFPGAIR